MCHRLTAIGLGVLAAFSGCAGQPAKSHGLHALGTAGTGSKVYYTSPEPMSSYLVAIVVFVPPSSSLEEVIGDPANSGVMVFDCRGGFAPSFGEPTMMIPRGSVVEAIETAICPSRR